MDKAKPENQVVHRYKQERSADTDLDRTMHLPSVCLFDVSVKIKAINSADTSTIANQFIRKKWLLDDLIHERPAEETTINDKQLSFDMKLSGH